MQTDLSNLKLGMYRCIVEDVEHPDKLLLAKVRILGDWDDLAVADLPWAEYLLPIGARVNDGEFKPCKKGDLVWCEFDRGDSRYPLIKGAVFFAPNDIPNVPHEAFNGPDCYQHNRTEAEPKPEPANYHKDWVSTQFDVMVERTESGAIRATHKPSGSAIEITNVGEIVIHAENDLFESTSKNKLLEAVLNITIKGGSNINIESSEASVNVNAAVDCKVNAPKIALNDGAGVVTTECVCQFTGAPHSDGSSTVTAGK